MHWPSECTGLVTALAAGLLEAFGVHPVWAIAAKNLQVPIKLERSPSALLQARLQRRPMAMGRAGQGGAVQGGPERHRVLQQHIRTTSIQQVCICQYHSGACSAICCWLGSWAWRFQACSTLSDWQGLACEAPGVGCTWLVRRAGSQVLAPAGLAPLVLNCPLRFSGSLEDGVLCWRCHRRHACS